MISEIRDDRYKDSDLNGFRVDISPDGNKFVHVYKDVFFFHIVDDDADAHYVMHLSRDDMVELLALERRAGQ